MVRVVQVAQLHGILERQQLRAALVGLPPQLLLPLAVQVALALVLGALAAWEEPQLQQAYIVAAVAVAVLVGLTE